MDSVQRVWVCTGTPLNTAVRLSVGAALCNLHRNQANGEQSDRLELRQLWTAGNVCAVLNGTAGQNWDVIERRDGISLIGEQRAKAADSPLSTFR